MYPPHSLGGYEIAWEGAVRHLCDRGHEVQVLASDFSLPGVDPGDERGVHRQLRWYLEGERIVSPGPLRRIAIERHNSRVLDRLLDEFRPDVVSWWSMGAMSLSLIERVRRRGIPAVGFVHDEWLAYGPKVDAWLRMCWRIRPFDRLLGAVVGVPSRIDLADAARWVFNSDYVRRHAEGWDLNLGDTEVLPPGVEDAFATAGRERSPGEWGGRLLAVGRLDPRKGHRTAIGALAGLPGASLRIAGAGHEEAELREVAQRFAPGRVEIGPVPRAEMPRVYASADALLFPVSWEEPFGLAPLEAMAAGTPVIATGTGGSAEYLADEENCLLVPPEDPEALAAAVRRLEGDPALRELLAEGGRRTASARSASAFNEGVERLLREAAGQGRPG